MSKALKKTILPIALGIAGNLIAPGIGSILGSTLSSGTLGAIGAATAAGGYNYSQNHNLGSALLAGGGSYIGSNLGSNLLGNTGGTVGSALNSGLGDELGQSVGSVIGASNVGANLGSTLGSFAGSSVGSDLASSLVPQTSGNVVGEGAMAPFRATRETEAQTPFSLQGLGSLDPNQLSSNIATGGVYGGGQGPDEQNYFLNMINRRLVDDSGNVDQNLNDVNPIENSYLSQLGLGGYGDANSLLEAISKKKKKAA